MLSVHWYLFTEKTNQTLCVIKKDIGLKCFFFKNLKIILHRSLNRKANYMSSFFTRSQETCKNHIVNLFSIKMCMLHVYMCMYENWQRIRRQLLKQEHLFWIRHFLPSSRKARTPLLGKEAFFLLSLSFKMDKICTSCKNI